MKNIQRPAMLNAPTKKVSVFGAVLSALLVVLLLFLVLELWFMGRYSLVHVDGSSMQNTLQDGDWLYAEKREVARGDIVTIDVSEYKTESGIPSFRDTNGAAIEVVIKRVIAKGGDTVKCEGGAIYLKKAGEETFERLEEPYALGKTGADFPATAIKEGEIFVLGDNRPKSHDSRAVGPLLEKDVLGVVPAWALEHKTAITRWGNFRENVRIAFDNAFGYLFG